MDAFEAISLPEPSATTGKKYFTPAEANRALVLVRRIVADIVRYYHELRRLHDAYQALNHGAEPHRAEQTRRRYIDVADRLAELRAELEEIGCELKDFELGLVNFPARREGREIFLCWQLGEPTVRWWHETTVGYAGRQPL